MNINDKFQQAEFSVKTFTVDDALIVSETTWVPEDPRQSIIRSVLNTREAQIRKALIDLGWTPPPEK